MGRTLGERLGVKLQFSGYHGFFLVFYGNVFLLRVCAYGVAKIIKYNIHEEVEVVNFSLMDWQSSIFIFFC